LSAWIQSGKRFSSSHSGVPETGRRFLFLGSKMSVADIALEYINHGFALVEIPRGEKGPLHKGWNLRANVLTRERAAQLNGSNLGLLHAFSMPLTCTMDIDDYPRSREWLEQKGVDLDSLMVAPDAVRISSDTIDHEKLLYRAPRLLRTVKIGDAGLELRCASEDGLSVQDVLPPSTHPSGRPYRWIGDFTELPPLPAPVYALWQSLEGAARQSSQEREDKGAALDDVFQLLVAKGMVMRRLEPGKYSVTCPCESLHSMKGGESATVYFLANYGGFYTSRFVCLHAHCKDRPQGEFQAAIGWVDPYDRMCEQHEREQADRGPERGYLSRRVSEVEARPIHWLWPGRIARGKVSMVVGHPGLGKSQGTLSIAAITSKGGRWPVDGMRSETGNVIILSAEDDAADTLRPRLEAAGADLTRVHILDAVRSMNGAPRPVNLKGDLEQLDAMLADIGDVALVIIDPVSAYLGDIDSHVNAEVRALLSPVGALAERHDTAIVAVSHFSKGGSEAVLRVTGSLAFSAAARSAYAVVKDKDNDARRLLLPIKNNIGIDQTGFAFTLESVEIKGTDCLISTSRVAWEPELVTVSVDEAMAVSSDPGERSAVGDAADFLQEVLASGPISARQVRREAEEAGHSWATVRRAQKTIGVVVAKTRGPKGQWEWRLARQDDHDEEVEI
jgi:hypothetical protein